MQIRVTTEFRFEMAHALLGHDGPCKNIHGHSYQLAVTLKGSPINNLADAKNGMVVDFTDTKKIVDREIIQLFDHALVLNKNTSVQLKSELKDQKLLLVAFQPTCENMLIHFVEKIKNVLPPEVTLHHSLLRETGTSFAEWYAEDNVSV